MRAGQLASVPCLGVAMRRRARELKGRHQRVFCLRVRVLRVLFISAAVTFVVSALYFDYMSQFVSVQTRRADTKSMKDEWEFLHVHRSFPRWRLYGAAFVGEAFSGQGKRGPSRRRDGTIKLFSTTGDTHIQQLVEGLHNLQIACHERPHSEQQELRQKYAKFLEALSMYTAFHKRERWRKGARRLVWVCDAYRKCGGLADRVRGITYALILSILSRRVLLLDWRNRLFGEHEYLEPNLIDWQLTQDERKRAYRDEYLGSTNLTNKPQTPGDSVALIHIFQIHAGIGIDVSVKDLQRNLEAIRGNWAWILLESNMEPSTLVDDTKAASLEWIRQGMAVLGLHKLTPNDIDSIVGLVFRYLFQFSEEILKEVAIAREVLGLKDTAYVGVHVRTGFAGSSKQEYNHPKLYREAWQWDRTLSCAYNYTTEQLGEKALLFLATDSNLVKSKTHWFGGRYRCLDNTVVHLDHLKKTPHKASIVEREGVLTMLVELILLAESHSIVMGESGFSFLAHSLCLVPRTKAINGLTCNPLDT